MPLRQQIKPSYVLRRHFGANLWFTGLRDRLARALWRVGL